MTRHAVVIGIDRYVDAPLTGCVADANDVAACLSLDQFGFDCEVLLDGRATRSSVLTSIGKRAYSADRRDFLLLYFAGHGHVLGDHGHLVTVDGAPHDPGVSLAHLGQLMESASNSYAHVLAVLDCCHSGAALTWVSSRPLQPRDIDREVQAVNESRCVLAACRPEQVAFGGSHGWFTQALLDGMLGSAVDFSGNVTVFGLHDYVSRALASTGQVPVFKGDAAGTVILGSGFEPRKGPPVEADELQRVLAKARSLIDEYYYVEQRETSDRGHRLREGAMRCAEQLEPRLTWFRQTETALPDVARHPDWVSMKAGLREFQTRLAQVDVGQITKWGEVKRNLGRGGFGHVWEIEGAEDQRLALKVFHGNELDDQIKVQRFQNGHGNMRKLDHPHIVRVYDLTDAPYGFLMDAVQGGNLRQIYLDPNAAMSMLRLLRDVVETVRHAHSRGVRHRDIKPENIIAVSNPDTGELVPYLTDFDLAYHETNRTVTAAAGVGGVINYAAPEQFYSPNTAAARAATVDVYSLAQLLFFVVTGKDPLPDNHDRNVARLLQRLNEWVEPRAAETLLDLYSRSTERDPSKRPQDVSEFSRVLARAEAYASASSGRDEVSEQDFCRRLGHVFSGIGRHRGSDSEVHMASLSQQVGIIVRNKGRNDRRSDHVDLEFQLSVTDRLPVGSVNSGSAARQAINSRLTKSLARFPGARRRAGTSGVFQTFIEVQVPLSVEGITIAADILTTAVAAIEAW